MPSAIFLDRRPGESHPEDLLSSRARRVGQHDPWDEGDDGQTIYATVADSAVELARIRMRLARLGARSAAIRGRSWIVRITEQAMIEADERAGLRLVDLAEDPTQPSLQRLHAAECDARLARDLEERRERDALVGYYVRDDRPEAPATVILSAAALRELLDEGLVEIEAYECVHLPDELFGAMGLAERFSSTKHAVVGRMNESKISGKLVASVLVGTAAIGWLIRLIESQ
jgi:hypothetical protein